MWVSAGRVDDPYDEFFIEERSLEGPSTGIDGMDIYDEEYCKTPAPARSLAATMSGWVALAPNSPDCL